MSPSTVLTRILVLVLALLLFVPATTLGQGGDEEDDQDEQDEREDRGRGRGDDRPGRSGSDEDDDNETDDDEDDDGRGRGRGGEKKDKDDDREERRIRSDVRQQVGRFGMADSGVTGRFLSFQVGDGGITDFAYRNHTFFTSIAYAPGVFFSTTEMKGVKFETRDGDAEFEAYDTPSGHFKAETDDGTLTITLGGDFTATMERDRSGHGKSKVQVTGLNLTAFLQGDDLRIENGTIIAGEEVRFIVHAPAVRGHLSSDIQKAAEDGRLAGEVLVTNETAEGAIAVPHGPYNLTVAQSHKTVTVTIEGHGNGSTLLFDLDRDVLGGIDDLVIHFDGQPIRAADDMEDVLNASADEDAEYLIIVGANKTQVLVSIPHFSVHTIQLSSVGAVQLLQPLLGSPVAAVAAAVLAVGFVAATWTIRNRQR